MKERGITNNAYYFTKELDSNVKVVFNLNKEESRIFAISSLYETGGFFEFGGGGYLIGG